MNYQGQHIRTDIDRVTGRGQIIEKDCQVISLMDWQCQHCLDGITQTPAE